VVRTVVLHPPPLELEQLIERRRRLGHDRCDEVWDGEYHMVPGPNAAHARLDQQLAELLGPAARQAGLTATGDFNLGERDDFRVPDRGVHDGEPRGTWVPTAALVVEILSPGDETWQKPPFYARRGVREVLIVDPLERAVHWPALAAGRYVERDRSAVLELGSDELAGLLEWPAVD
jgi:Uma2 family endonuclease